MPFVLPISLPPVRSCRASSRAAAVFVLFASGFGSARAADFTLGIAGGPDRGKVDCVESFPCDRSSASFKLTGAYRLAPALDLQAVYFGSGKWKGGDTTPLGTEFGGSFKVRGVGLTTGYRWDFAPSWNLVGRAGAAGVHTKFDFDIDAYGSASKTKLEPLAGASVGYAISPQWSVGIDYDVTRFKVHTEHGTLQMLGLAVHYSF